MKWTQENTHTTTTLFRNILDILTENPPKRIKKNYFCPKFLPRNFFFSDLYWLEFISRSLAIVRNNSDYLLGNVIRVSLHSWYDWLPNWHKGMSSLFFGPKTAYSKDPLYYFFFNYICSLVGTKYIYKCILY